MFKSILNYDAYSTSVSQVYNIVVHNYYAWHVGIFTRVKGETRCVKYSYDIFSICQKQCLNCLKKRPNP